MTIDFSTFEKWEFPESGDIVYVLQYVLHDGAQPVPFYVGETSRHVGRFGDYISGKYSAQTDFKVGEAVKYLREKGAKIEIRFRAASDRRAEEKDIIRTLRTNKFSLLNDLRGYVYDKADVAQERMRIRQFVDDMLM